MKFTYHTQGPALSPYYRGEEEGGEEQKREEVRKIYTSIRMANSQKTQTIKCSEEGASGTGRQ